MRALAITLVALAVGATTAQAATPIGAPRALRVASAADLRPHPSARTEFWELLAIDPRTRLTLTVRLRRAPGLFESVDVFLNGHGQERTGAALKQSFRRASGATVRFAGEGGTSTIARRRGNLALTMSGPQVSGRVTLRRPRPGPAARGWRLGPAPRAEKQVQTGLSWSMPVATSTLRGKLAIAGRTVKLDGWRASLEHAWGSFDLLDPWSRWDLYAVHGRRGTAWVAFGLNRRDTLLGPGAVDAQWLGVLGRVGSRGTRVCRPAVHRRRWTWGGDYEPSWSRELRARCAGLRVRLHDDIQKDVRQDLLRRESFEGFVEYVDHGQAGGRGVGFARHRSHGR